METSLFVILFGLTNSLHTIVLAQPVSNTISTDLPQFLIPQPYVYKLAMLPLFSPVIDCTKQHWFTWAIRSKMAHLIAVIALYLALVGFGFITICPYLPLLLDQI